MRRHIVLFGIITALALTSLGCGRKESNVIARVNRQPITREQLFDALEKADNGEAGRHALDSLIVRQLIRQEAQKRDLSVSREELDKRLEALKDYILAATGKNFATWLEETGQTEEDLSSRISVQILTAKLAFTDDEKQAYFEENRKRLESLPHNNESVIYRRIVVDSKDEAEAVRAELLDSAVEGKVSSEKFIEVAAQSTIDPVERQRGGMAGWLVQGKSGDQELEDVLFALEPGVLSESLPVKIPDAEPAEGVEQEPQEPRFYRVLLVEKQIPQPSELTLEQNADVIEEWMLNDPRFQLQLQEFFSNLRAKADVEILASRYEAVGKTYLEGREARERRLSETENLVPVMPQPTDAVPALEANEAAGE